MTHELTSIMIKAQDRQTDRGKGGIYTRAEEQMKRTCVVVVIVIESKQTM